MKRFLSGALTLCFIFATTAFGQGLTSSEIRGVVTDASGKPVSGATVTAFFEPTNSTATTTTNTSGSYSFPGLRVGGPYTITATANGFQKKEEGNVQLELSQIFQGNFALDGVGEVVKMEAVTATAESNTLFDGLITGTSTQLSQERIRSLPTISRSLNEYARLDPRVVITDRTNGETSAAGQNGRYNSIRIDGVRSNDVFGLTTNGLPSQGNPISIDTIEAFNLDLSPYDVRESGFTGAAFNAVTKSGTNEFHGSAYYVYTNQNLRSKNETPNTLDANFGKREPFNETTYGATLGGPILKDKLFFFVSYEKFERKEPTPSAVFIPSQAAIDAIVAAAKSYGYDPGTLSNGGEQERSDKKILAKIDWNINALHRASFRFNQTDGSQPIFQDFSATTGTSLSGHWYTNHQKDTNYVASLFSNWTPEFTTEAKVSYSEYKTRREPASIFPQVEIYNVPSAGTGAAGNIYLGTERSTQINRLNVKTQNASLAGTYLLGAHTIMVGGDYEQSKFFDPFVQDYLGSYGTATTTSLTSPGNAGFNFATQITPTGFVGSPSAYSYQYALNGTIAPNWKMANPAAFAQDTWRINSQLTLTAGLRYDYYSSDKPGYNALGSQIFGINNANSIDGRGLLAPRVGFNYALGSDKKTQIRGGGGVFAGTSPGVWLNNSFATNGLIIGQSTKTPTLSTFPAGTVITFNPNPAQQQVGGTATAALNLMANDFKLPSAFKANLAVDRKLPWFGLVATVSFDETKTLENFWYNTINRQQIGTLPDGRNRYNGAINTAFTDVYLLRNTTKGDAQNYTFQLQRPWKKGWTASFSYTRGKSDEVSPITSSTASTNFGSRMIYNPNDENLARSNYEVRDRFLLSASREFHFFREFSTVTSFFYETRTGRPYSYTFSNDVNGDGQTNDLFYVPTGPADPKVRFSTPAQSDAFFSYLAGNPDLTKYMGQVVPRNSAYSKSIQQLDFRLTQEVPIWGKFKGELDFDILNVGNLINSHWGRYSLVGFPYSNFVANASYDAVANQYIYTYSSTPRGQTMDTTLSRWQMQWTLRIKF